MTSFTDAESPAFLRIFYDSAGFRRGYLDRGFIGFDHHDVFIAFDKVTFVLEPFADGHF